MHDGGAMAMGFSAGSWGFGLVIWLVVILASVALIKYLIRTRP